MNVSFYESPKKILTYYRTLNMCPNEVTLNDIIKHSVESKNGQCVDISNFNVEDIGRIGLKTIAKDFDGCFTTNQKTNDMFSQALMQYLMTWKEPTRSLKKAGMMGITQLRGKIISRTITQCSYHFMRTEPFILAMMHTLN